MSIFPNNPSHILTQKLSNHLKRYGAGATLLILAVDALWAASVLVPVLFVIGTLFEFTNGWFSVLPGLLGAVTFLILLTIGGLAAALPSTYVARWRDRTLDRIAARYPETIRRPVVPVDPVLGYGPDVQDAD